MFGTEKSLLGKLKAYGESDYYPFHMPGHKRRSIVEFPNPYEIDITEIDGFDNLHHAEGILKESMEQAAKIYNADRTYYLVNGSTCGILSAICGCTRPGDGILMARNCHKAAFHGMILQSLKPYYLYPEYLKDFGINGGILAEDVEKALKEHTDIKAVMIVSPTFEGVVSDVGAIADVAHKYGVPLIVDEAHGAHFPFAAGNFPKSAVICGADIIIQSLHKTLPSFTQTAILHVNDGVVDPMKVERYLGMFQSSSPSYIFMAAMEQCVSYMDQVGREEMKHYEARLNAFYDRLNALKILNVLGKNMIKKASVYDWDMSKVVVLTRKSGLGGNVLSNMLRKKYHLEMEMSGPEYVVGMTSLMDTEEGLNRLADALLELDDGLERIRDRTETDQTEQEKICRSSKSLLAEIPKAISVMTLADAMHADGWKVNLCESEGRISQEFLYLYPPGIPILAPGEQITSAILDRVTWYREQGLSVQGLADPMVSSIITVAEE